MTSNPNADIEKTGVAACQGSTRPNLIYVLGASLVLVRVVFAVVWFATKR